MNLTYAPEGADPKTWRFEPGKLLSSEAIAIEKVTGWGYEEFGTHLVKRAVLARKALLWVFLKRAEPTLRFDQLDPQVSTIVLEYDVDELHGFRDQVEADGDMSDAERRNVLAVLDEEIAAAEVDEAPKVPAENESVTPISASSRTSSTSDRKRSTA